MLQARITEAENGVWACRVFLSGTSRSPAERASTNVTVLGWFFLSLWFILFFGLFSFYFYFFFAALPQISLRPRDDPITVIAGESAQIDCMVADARPAPAIIWMLGITNFHQKFFFLFSYQDSWNNHFCQMTHIFLDHIYSIKKSFYLEKKGGKWLQTLKKKYQRKSNGVNDCVQ